MIAYLALDPMLAIEYNLLNAMTLKKTSQPKTIMHSNLSIYFMNITNDIHIFTIIYNISFRLYLFGQLSKTSGYVKYYILCFCQNFKVAKFC